MNEFDTLRKTDESETLNKARRLENRRPHGFLQFSTPGTRSQGTDESQLSQLAMPHNLSEDRCSTLMSNSRDPDLLTSINPEASADFPDVLDMAASINPEASANFPDASTSYAAFWNSTATHADAGRFMVLHEGSYYGNDECFTGTLVNT